MRSDLNIVGFTMGVMFMAGLAGAAAAQGWGSPQGGPGGSGEIPQGFPPPGFDQNLGQQPPPPQQGYPGYGGQRPPAQHNYPGQRQPQHVPGQGHWGTPGPLQGQQQGPYGPPPQYGQGGYGAPRPPQGGGYGAPPQYGQGGYGQPPANAYPPGGGYGPPPGYGRGGPPPGDRGSNSDSPFNMFDGMNPFGSGMNPFGSD